MTYDAIVFDLDGVLLRGHHTDRDIYRAAVLETLADFGVDVSDPPEELVDPDDPAVVRRHCSDFDIPADAFWAYREHAATVRENEEIRMGGRKPYSDTDVLPHLADGRRLGIVSNNRQGTVRFVVDHFDWESYVESLHGRYPTLAGIDWMKPDPEYLERAIDDLDVDPSGTLFVGDRASDVTTAHRAGTDVALLVREGEKPSSAYRPTAVIDSLQDVIELSGGVR
ncbi:MAG: HAD family hydrolase [Halodesulfurarchaeum sp.]